MTKVFDVPETVGSALLTVVNVYVPAVVSVRL